MLSKFNRSVLCIATIGVIASSFSFADEPTTQPATVTSDTTESSPEATPEATPDSSPKATPEDAKVAAYGVGYDFGWRIKPFFIQTGNQIDMDALMQGINDAIADIPPKHNDEEVAACVEALRSVIEGKMAENEKKSQEMFEQMAAKDAEFLAQNKIKSGVTTTASGLQFETVQEGSGPMPSAGDSVKVHYKGTFTDGREFDSSYGGDPAIFPVQGVISGFSEGLMLTKVGGKSRLVIPYDLAYGERGSPPQIPPRAALVFEIELVEIVSPGSMEPSDAPDEATTEIKPE
ncbi:MAG TPA: FKBP-type peptidyl-prolyl cis-trans isomerase [Tepidisphaeraceae bacterium]|nr:FKBP-type peptidyl-prolyl cis-trans isomerase [Tepidisphaeraceae bacterium]